MIILYVVLAVAAALLVLFFLVLHCNAVRSKRRRVSEVVTPQTVSDDRCAAYAASLARLIRCQTVADGAHEAEFEAFRNTLLELFPLLHARAEFKSFNGCLVYKIAGKDARKNVLLMSHHDVVAADEAAWSHPPFQGEIVDGVLWGRGTVDTKTPLFSQLTAVEELLRDNVSLDRINLFLASSANEEICGDGIPEAVNYFKQNGIRFDVVSDEGGAIVTGMMPGVSRKSAMVAVHEKGRHIFECVAESADRGHLGLNAVKSNAVERMASFIAEVKRSKLFRVGFAPEVEQMFKTHAPYMNYPMRLLFSNFGVFRRLLLAVLPKISTQVGGMLGTTQSFTRISGGTDPQIQAKSVAATAFFRAVREEDLEAELLRFRSVAAKYGVGVNLTLRDFCKPSSADAPQFKTLRNVLNRNFPNVVVSPFLLTAGTDARHFSEIADCILRFAPIDLSPQQFRSVHNPDENISVRNVGECVRFYRDYIVELNRA